MAQRKSIVNVQLGSVTPSKNSHNKNQKTESDMNASTLPLINSAATEEKRPAEITPTKPTGNTRVARPSILNKSPANPKNKSDENVPSVEGNTNDESKQPYKTSRPSMIYKQGTGSLPQKVAIVPKDMSFVEDANSSKKIVPEQIRKQSIKGTAQTPAQPSQILEPSVPTQPPASNRPHRVTIVSKSTTERRDASPKGQSFIQSTNVVKTSLEEKAANAFNQAANLLVTSSLTVGIRNICRRFSNENENKNISSNIRTEVQSLAEEVISISVINALRNIKESAILKR